MKKPTSNTANYNPNIGFIGQSEVTVSNYLFSNTKERKSYRHSKPMAERILSESVDVHYKRSRKLTRFLRKRDLTFSKKTSDGHYKTFSVPCTATVVPLQKSLFNKMEQASQRLVIALRKVLQDIYGSKSLKSSHFIKSLPLQERKIFIEAIENSPHYYPQLHHPNMKTYPFFDVVGLDLVLVDENDESGQLPFRVLELNAGSPSGASNNINVLEGLKESDPDLLESLGRILPNDHFKVLGQTYKSLGKDWTKVEKGIQVILPPGGQNGAAPEIHQLALYSGLVYADPNQLYQDEEGFIRLRTVGKDNPIVNAIYSRVNADSALFDPDKGIVLRDPDSGEPYYLKDYLKVDYLGNAPLIKDSKGNPIPVRSIYAIPGLVDAIINKKIYMGGLNRVLDNKIILSTLTHFAPKFYQEEIKMKGVSKDTIPLRPPQTLPPTKESVETILRNPDDWVIKAPSLAGGEGVYILKTLPMQRKNEVLKMIVKRPQAFAYQQLVKIGRIPVAVANKNGARFANLAADMRMWVFYGGEENELPKLTHNALVRYAPQEKGKMSSIVNTSSGGGYAPFVIVDDTNSAQAIEAKDISKLNNPIDLPCSLPIFVASQLVQASRLIALIHKQIAKEDCYLFNLYGNLLALRDQLKEVVSFLHPNCMENLAQVLISLEAKYPKLEIVKYYVKITENQGIIVALLKDLEKRFGRSIIDKIENLRILNTDKINLGYTDDERSLDFYFADEIQEQVLDWKESIEKQKALRMITLIKECILTPFPQIKVHKRTRTSIAKFLQEFTQSAQSKLALNPKTKQFSPVMQQDLQEEIVFEGLYLNRNPEAEIINPPIATAWERAHNKTLLQSSFITPKILNIREQWVMIQQAAKKLPASERSLFLEEKRKHHFKNFPELANYQRLIGLKDYTKNDLLQLLEIMPYAKFNIENFAKDQNVKVEDLFTYRLRKNRLCLLSNQVLSREKLSEREYSGECFAKKKQSHGLYSQSDVFIWLRKSLDPFTLLYTAGHEITHYHQIQNSMKQEKQALAKGELEFAKFINYYGHFLGANQRSLDLIDSEMTNRRKPLYGFVDRIMNAYHSPPIVELREALAKSDEAWNEKLAEYGGLLTFMMPISSGVKVRALQEVIPALENAKNILFAQELGLIIPNDPIKSALPTANQKELQKWGGDIIKACQKPFPSWEILRVMASHQYYGVRFFRADKDEENLLIRPHINVLNIGESYNQTQQ